MNHFIRKCRICQTIVAQCRCPSLNKVVEWVESCPSCPPAKAPVKNVMIPLGDDRVGAPKAH